MFILKESGVLLTHMVNTLHYKTWQIRNLCKAFHFWILLALRPPMALICPLPYSLFAPLPWWCWVLRYWHNQSQTSSHIAEFPGVYTAGYPGTAARCWSLLGAAGLDPDKLSASANTPDSGSSSSKRDKWSLKSHGLMLLPFLTSILTVPTWKRHSNHCLVNVKSL